jgi:hypothetical protein
MHLALHSGMRCSNPQNDMDSLEYKTHRASALFRCPRKVVFGGSGEPRQSSDLIACACDGVVKFRGNNFARAAVCNGATAMINKRINPSMTAEDTEIFGFCLRGCD